MRCSTLGLRLLNRAGCSQRRFYNPAARTLHIVLFLAWPIVVELVVATQHIETHQRKIGGGLMTWNDGRRREGIQDILNGPRNDQHIHNGQAIAMRSVLGHSAGQIRPMLPRKGVISPLSSSRSFSKA